MSFIIWEEKGNWQKNKLFFLYDIDIDNNWTDPQINSETNRLTSPNSKSYSSDIRDHIKWSNTVYQCDQIFRPEKSHQGQKLPT